MLLNRAVFKLALLLALAAIPILASPSEYDPPSQSISRCRADPCADMEADLSSPIVYQKQQDQSCSASKTVPISEVSSSSSSSSSSCATVASAAAPSSGIKRTRERCIGLGTDGMVWLVRKEGDGVEERIAEKSLSISWVSTLINDQVILMEISAMMELKDALFPNLYDFKIDGDFVRIDMEYVDGKTMEAVMKEFGCFEYSYVKYLARRLLKALIYMASKEWAHCDLSKRNIIILPNGDLKVIDMGRAFKKQGKHHLNDKQMLDTWAPEARGQFMTPKSDVWSWGVIVFNACTAQNLFADLNSIIMNPSIGHLPRDVQAVIRLAITRDVVQRPTAEDLMGSQYFASEDGDFSEFLSKLAEFCKLPSPSIPEHRIESRLREIENDKWSADACEVAEMKGKILDLKRKMNEKSDQ